MDGSDEEKCGTSSESLCVFGFALWLRDITKGRVPNLPVCRHHLFLFLSPSRASLPSGQVPVQQHPVQAAGLEVRRRGRLRGQLGREPGGVQ